jgi:hypothetical protein
MKKLTIILIILFFVQSLCVFAKDNSSGKEKKSLSLQDRSLEIGFAHINVNFANNILSYEDIFQEVITIDLDKLADGFMFNLGANITPFYFTIKSKKGWGFGLSTNIEAIGALSLSGNMLTIDEAIADNSDIRGAVFASAAINTFFDVQKYKIKFSPSLFYPLAYVTPPVYKPSSAIYTLDYSDGTKAYIDYDVRIYTGFSWEDENFSLTSNPGVDYTIGVEYPFSKEKGLSDKIPLLDFDVGLDLINVPFIPSTMISYMQVKGRIGKEKITIFGDNDEDDEGFFSSDEIDTKEKYLLVSRPFKMLVHADWRPLFKSKFLTITPVIGFCYSKIYSDPFSLEAGLNACLNFGNIFLLKAGLSYTDRIFVNSFGIVLNSKALEIDIGADLRAQNFDQLWTGVGLGLNFGFKIGW